MNYYLITRTRDLSLIGHDDVEVAAAAFENSSLSKRSRGEREREQRIKLDWTKRGQWRLLSVSRSIAIPRVLEQCSLIPFSRPREPARRVFFGEGTLKGSLIQANLCHVPSLIRITVSSA